MGTLHHQYHNRFLPLIHFHQHHLACHHIDLLVSTALASEDFDSFRIILSLNRDVGITDNFYSKKLDTSSYLCMGTIILLNRIRGSITTYRLQYLEWA